MITVLRQKGHTNGSGAKLATVLGLRSTHNESVRTCRGTRYVINWGVSQAPTLWRQREIVYSNTPQAVNNCVNKARCLMLLTMAPVPCLDATTQGYLAEEWLQNDGKVVVRTVLNGHSGQGIQIVREGGAIPPAPLYARYFKKDFEYRVHVAFGKVILIQQKKKGENYRDLNEDDPDRKLIRTYDNGWIFSVNDLDCDVRNYREHLEKLALDAAEALQINHGAVDILVKLKKNGNHDIRVCEVNSAPSLYGASTMRAYAAAFSEYLTSLNAH